MAVTTDRKKKPTNRTESVEVWLRGQYSFSHPASRTETVFARTPNVSKLARSYDLAFFIFGVNSLTHFDLPHAIEFFLACCVPIFSQYQVLMSNNTLGA